MQRFPPPVLIDEIQYAPELLPYIKMACDQRLNANLFWLTGSQQFQMMRGVSESLAGRAGVLQLLGFSRRELLGRGETSTPFLPLPESNDTSTPLDLMELYRLIWRGSFPAIALSEQGDRDLFYSSYIRTYLQRDLRNLTRVGDEMTKRRSIC